VRVLREGEAWGRATSPAADPRLDALGRSDGEDVRGAMPSDGRDPALPRTLAGSLTAVGTRALGRSTAALPLLGTRALGRSAADGLRLLGTRALGRSAAGSSLLGTRALGRPTAGRSALGVLPTAGVSRPAEGVRAGEPAFGTLGLTARAG
jgi:hypothetical protein